MTCLCKDDSINIKEYRNRISDVRINNGAIRLKEYLKNKVNSLDELNLLENHLRLIVVREDEDKNIFVNDRLKGLLDKYELKF